MTDMSQHDGTNSATEEYPTTAYQGKVVIYVSKRERFYYGLLLLAITLTTPLWVLINASNRVFKEVTDS